MNVGLLLLRVIVGLLFIGHGTQKLFGWFGGGGIRGAQGYFESLGYPPTPIMAILAGMAEAGGGAALLIGWFTPFAAAAITVVMLNVIGVKWSRGLWEVHDGFEYPLVIIGAVLSLAFGGPGSYSVDHLLGWQLAGIGWGVAALTAALVVGVTSGITRQAVRSTASGSPATHR